jgi:N-acetylmuramoyl-L-alanine amidase
MITRTKSECMTNSVRAGLALGAGLLLLAAAEAPIRDQADGQPGSGPAAGEASNIATGPAQGAQRHGTLVRIEGPATPIPVFSSLSPRSIVDADSGEEIVLPDPAAGAPAPRSRTLAEAVDRYRGQPDSALDADARCLAKAVYWEAKGEPLSGQLAVAQVILNRVESRRFGGDICAVVTAPRQFSFVRAGRIPDAPHGAQWATAKAVTLLALDGTWHEVVGEATHFHATRVNPRWRLTRVATIGNHIFYR